MDLPDDSLCTRRARIAVRELEPWEEGGETWQRIGVGFPSEIHTHCLKQILYFDQKGLVRRHDYTSEVYGTWAKAAHYPSDHQTFEGVVVPTRRRVFLRRRDNRPLTAVPLIWLDIETVRLVSAVELLHVRNLQIEYLSDSGQASPRNWAWQGGVSS